LKRNIPLVVCLVMGVSMMVQFFVPHPVSVAYYELTTRWFRIVAAFALVLGTGSLIMYHSDKIQRKRQGWFYSVVTILAFVATAVIGLGWGIKRGTILQDVIFSNILVPLNASMFAILAFYMASAAYRAFRARTKEASLLLIAAFVVMLGMVPLGANLPFRLPALVLLTVGVAVGIYLAVRNQNWRGVLVLGLLWVLLGLAVRFLFAPRFGAVAEQVLSYPNMAAKRAIVLGVALGAVATSLKVILGIERGWLGGGKS